VEVLGLVVDLVADDLLHPPEEGLGAAVVELLQVADHLEDRGLHHVFFVDARPQLGADLAAYQPAHHNERVRRQPLDRRAIAALGSLDQVLQRIAR
jgi:hypothetical protein